LWLAEQVTGIQAPVLANVARVELADSTLRARAAQFEDHEFYPGLSESQAALLRRWLDNGRLYDRQLATLEQLSVQVTDRLLAASATSH
jgi:hypothetical protein